VIVLGGFRPPGLVVVVQCSNRRQSNRPLALQLVGACFYLLRLAQVAQGTRAAGSSRRNAPVRLRLAVLVPLAAPLPQVRPAPT